MKTKYKAGDVFHWFDMVMVITGFKYLCDGIIYRVTHIDNEYHFKTGWYDEGGLDRFKKIEI